jgi:uncharacterized protein YegP (UPF0339 family)
MKIEFYLDNKFENRWRAVARNGKVVAESGEGYTERRDAQAGFDSLREAIVMDYLAGTGEAPTEGHLDIRYVARDVRAQHPDGR